MSGAPIPLRGASTAPSSASARERPVRSLRGDARRLGRRLVDEIDARPFHAVVGALCVGFALGGGVPRGALTLLLGVGARAAGARLGEAFLANAPKSETAQEDLQ